MKLVLHQLNPVVRVVGFDRTYEELKLCLREKGGESVPTGFDRTYEELKHLGRVQLFIHHVEVLIVPMRN